MNSLNGFARSFVATINQEARCLTTKPILLNSYFVSGKDHWKDEKVSNQL